MSIFLTLESTAIEKHAGKLKFRRSRVCRVEKQILVES